MRKCSGTFLGLENVSIWRMYRAKTLQAVSDNYGRSNFTYFLGLHIRMYKLELTYCIAGNFCGIILAPFSCQHHTHIDRLHVWHHIFADFAVLSFTALKLSMKKVNFAPCDNFLLYDPARLHPAVCLHVSAHCSGMQVLVEFIILLGCAHEQKAHGGAVDRRGQEQRSVCDTHGPYQMIWSKMKQVFLSFRLMHCEITQMLRSWDLVIFVLTD
jgi:hypothetical protein